MPPALHPKSLSTASLFTSTAILAFLVVGAPHILPCPAPKQQYADDDARQKKSKKKCPVPRINGEEEEGKVVVEQQ
jgi:cytochrome c oxidase assembly factor 2